MPRCLLIHRVDQIKSVLREATLIDRRIHPDRKELGAQIAGSGLVEADVAKVFRVGGPNVEVAIQESLRRVGMRVDHYGGVMNRTSTGAYSWNVRALG